MVNTALVGAGYWGSKLQSTLEKIKTCKVVQVIDIKQNQTLDDLQDDVEAVVIATPAWEHHKDVLKAMKKNLHVYVEKPMCISNQEADEIVKNYNGKTFMVGHIFLYNKCVEELKKEIRPEKIMYIEIERQNWGRYQHKISPIQSFAPHDFAILDYWLGKLDIDNINVKGHYITQTEQPDHIDAHFRCHNQRLFVGPIDVSMRYSWSCPSKIRMIRIHENDRVIEYDDTHHSVTILYPSMKDGRFNYEPTKQVSTFTDHSPLEAEMEHFFDCIENTIIPVSDQFNGMRITALTNQLDDALTQSKI